MRRLLVAVVVVLVVLVGGFLVVDVWTRAAMERQLSDRVNGYEPGAHASVRIHAFPWLPPLLSSGTVSRVTAHATEVSQGDFVLDSVDISVTGVRVNRHQLLNKREIDIVSITEGTVTADMTQANLDRLLGVPVTLGKGTASVTVAGVTAEASVSVRNGHLELENVGVPLSVPIPTLPVLPCLANATVLPGHLALSCTFHEVPPALKMVLQSGAG